MQINPYLRKELVTDIRFCANKILEEKDLQRKMYFYGRTYYATARVLDFNYDKQLAFIQFVLEVSHSTIDDRVESIVEEETTIPIIDGIFEGITENLNDLANKIENDEDTYETLQKIVEITYLTTVGGYYKYLRGMIKP